MPLMPGKTPEAIAANIKTESRTKPDNQAVAIALNVARKSGTRHPEHKAITQAMRHGFKQKA